MSKHQSEQERTAIMRSKRDAKVHDHLSQYAPVWLTKEEVLLAEDVIRFEVVFDHPHYGWVKRRYRFDSYNNVLYYNGQVKIDEEQTFELQNETPYISAEFVNTVNSYGG